MTRSNRAKKQHWITKILTLVNLRPEEGERTFLMFFFYTITSVGLLWLEQTAIALFLERFGAKGLPWVYITSAVMGSGLGLLYSWLQNNFPLKKVFIAIALLMALPLLLFRIGIELEGVSSLIVLITVFLMRLWLDAEEILNDLNSQVAANQLFNIREIKRTYPIISSGMLLGDVLSGFSMPLLLNLIGLKNILVAACVMVLLGGGILLYLSQLYKQAFPDTPVRELDELQPDYSSRRTSGSFQKYLIPLFAFFILGELLFLLVEFQYLGELELRYPDTEEIAGFLGLFSGCLGICELITQWFVSSRAVERLGVFVAAMFLPVSLSVLGLVTIVVNISGIGGIQIESAQILFFGTLVLKFFDELLRYTLIAGIEPFLFQPLPVELRSSIQTQVQGIAEPLTTGLTGLTIIATVWLIPNLLPTLDKETIRQLQGAVFVAGIVLFSLVWAASALLLRQSYVTLLVQNAEQGRLGFSNVDLGAFKRAIVESLDRDTKEDDKRSCIQLLQRIDLPNAGEILAPRLIQLSTALQKQSLEMMLEYPKTEYLPDIQRLIMRKPALDVLTLALRYLWVAQPELEIHPLTPYLNHRIDPRVRGMAAGLILSRGTPEERQEAQNTLQQMLRSPIERERVLGVQALRQTEGKSPIAHEDFIQLLQDDSARVRCVVLETITAKELKDYYPALIKGLNYRTTRESAKKALIQLKNEALPLLIPVSENPHEADYIRLQVWSVMAEINTEKSIAILIDSLLTNWGIQRRNILRILLKMPNDRGIEAVLEKMGRSGVETCINQELFLLGHILGAGLDLSEEIIQGREADLLRSALEGMEKDIIDRCFLLMKFLYPFSAIQAAILNLDSDSEVSIALGLEILDNTLDLPQKQTLLRILERRSLEERVSDLGDLVNYEPLSPPERLRYLLNFRYFLSDWTLTCCFHLARSARWRVMLEALFVGLGHPSSFVREAVLAYLKEASPRTCLELLPILKNDPDPLVASQIDRLKKQQSKQSNGGK